MNNLPDYLQDWKEPDRSILIAFLWGVLFEKLGLQRGEEEMKKLIQDLLSTEMKIQDHLKAHRNLIKSFVSRTY